MKRIVILAVFILAVCHAAPISIELETAEDLAIRNEFSDYVVKFNKPYSVGSLEFETRLQNYKANLEIIKQLSKQFPTAQFGPNEFADLSQEEFSKRLNPKTNAGDLARSCLANGVGAPKLSTENLPTSFDWRSKGIVTPVKNQGMCGSCWAFSTTGVIESQWALKGHNLTRLSEQMIVDCSKSCTQVKDYEECNQGCNGGWQWTAYTDIINWKGVATEADYPYTARDGTCKLDGTKVTATITNYTCLSSPEGADEDQMAAYLVEHGPLAVALNAFPLQFYWGGVIDPYFEWECDPTTLTHAVLIVGYDTYHSSIWGDIPYWIVKNSWGASWGESGYFYMAKGFGTCGINNAVSTVIL